MEGDTLTENNIQRSMTEVQAAVDAIVTKARSKHKGIPETVVVIGASGVTRQGQKLGHFQAKSWKLKGGTKDDLYGEIQITGEGLARGGTDTLGTLLHELAHAYCHANNIKDTSNGNRYHNTKFKEVAEEFGLEIEKADVIGWSNTTVPHETANEYAAEIEALGSAIRTHRLSYSDLAALGVEPEKTKPKVRKMQCPTCKEPLVVTKKWWELQGNGGGDYEHGVGLLCGTHDEPYEIYEEGGNDE